MDIMNTRHIKPDQSEDFSWQNNLYSYILYTKTFLMTWITFYLSSYVLINEGFS